MDMTILIMSLAIPFHERKNRVQRISSKTKAGSKSGCKKPDVVYTSVFQGIVGFN